MSLKLWDFKCKACGKIFEDIVEAGELAVKCRCGDEANRIFTPSGVFTANEDAAWIKTVLEVVDKDDKSIHTQRFIKNPTRSNYKEWMKGEGLRPLEVSKSQHGEEYQSRRDRLEYEKNHTHMMTEAVLSRRAKRNRIEIF